MAVDKARLVGGIGFQGGVASMFVDRGLASGKLDEVEVSEAQLLQIIRDVAIVLDTMRRRRAQSGERS
jgi:hypothetical protein